MEPVATNITVEVHCNIPNWALLSENAMFKDNKYRLFVNEDLITERSWCWDHTNTYILENVQVQLNKNCLHTICLIPVLTNPAQADFVFKNFSISELCINKKAINNRAITFTLG
jgi:hypothetical protein